MSVEAPRHVDIEAGHYYAGQKVYKGYPGRDYPVGGPGKEVVGSQILQGIRVAQGIISEFERTGLTVGRSLFVDDTALMSYWQGKADQGMIETRVIGVTTQQIMDSGYKPHLEFRESKLEEPARELVAVIQKRVKESDEYVLSSDGRKIKYKESGKTQSIVLLGKDNDPYDPDYPSCDVLDVVLYRERLRLAPTVATVLPESYKPQQERVKKLFEILGEEPSVVVVYFSEEGAISEIDPWSEGARDLAETIQTA